MSKDLAEERVFEDEAEMVVGLIVLMARPFFKWDCWVIVEVPKLDRYWSSEDPTFGHSGFRAVRGLERYYVNDITYYARKLRPARSQATATKRATKAARHFIAWRAKQKEAIAEVEARRVTA